jgi:DNA-binding LacI/PurR family transcriptional regulator
MKRCTISDVAKLAGVSPSSVSRYVNDHSAIKAIPAIRIDQAIKDLGYIPNQYAKSLKKGCSNTIGIIIPSLGPYFTSICTALEDFFYQHKYLLFICVTNNDFEKEKHFVDSLLGQRVAGLFIAPSGVNKDYLRGIHEQFQHIVLLDYIDESFPFDTVYGDTIKSSYEIIRYMIEKGHSRFMLILREKNSTNTIHHLEGSARAFKEKSLDINDMIIITNQNYPAQITETLKSAFKSPNPPTAIVAYSPLILENTFFALNMLNKRIPEDVGLAGFTMDDFNNRFHTNIPLVVQQPYEIGIKAADILLRRIKRSGARFVPKKYCIEEKLITTKEPAK